MKNFLVRAVLFAFFLPLSVTAADFKAGEILVRFKENPSRADLDAQALRLGQLAGISKARVQSLLRAEAGGVFKNSLRALSVETWTLTSARSVTALAAALTSNPLVEYAEPNIIYQKYASGAGPKDDLIDSQWYYSQIKADVAFDAYKAGTFVLPNTVKVALLDTGLARSAGALHPQLDYPGLVDTLNAKNFYTGPGENAATWDKDDSGHGTAVAGVLGAETEDSAGGSGIAGVFFDHTKLTLLPVKVLGGSTGVGTLDEITAGILYAVAQNVKIINMSLGATVSSITMENATTLAVEAGVLIVAAAGNEGSMVSFPAAYPNVLAVGALNTVGARAAYSNFGELDISAPGGNASNACTCVLQSSAACVTTWSTEILSLGAQTASDCGVSNAYVASGGTSFAAPMVSAAAALLLAQDNTRSASDLLRILTQSADATPHGSGYTTQAGWGRLNIFKALSGDTFRTEFKSKALKVYNWPNPFNPKRHGFTTITFILQQPQSIRISIFDQGGDRVYREDINQSSTLAGMNTRTWDGKNTNGSVVANGSYMLVLENDSSRVTHWVAVLR